MCESTLKIRYNGVVVMMLKRVKPSPMPKVSMKALA